MIHYFGGRKWAQAHFREGVVTGVCTSSTPL